MIHLTKFMITLLIFLITNTMLFSQDNLDSLRLVNDALKMIQFPESEFNEPFIPKLNPKAMADMRFEQAYTSETVNYKMRDGIQIHGQQYKYATNKTVILLHGTLASSYTYNKSQDCLEMHYTQRFLPLI